MRSFDTQQLTADDVSALHDAERGVEDAIVVRPHKDNSGIPGMDDVLRSLPRAETETTGLRRREQNVSTPFSFEMRYTQDDHGPGERVISLQYVGGNEEMNSHLGMQLADKYPDSRTETQEPAFLHPEEGQHMAAATLGLRRYTLYPWKNTELDSFSSDPTGSILTEMVGAGEAGGVDADVAVQVMVRPVPNGWKQGVKNGLGIADAYGDGLTKTEDKVNEAMSARRLRALLGESTYERRSHLPTKLGDILSHAHPLLADEYYHDPSQADKKAKRMLSDLDGRGWEINVRIMAVSDDPELASERVAYTCAMFDNFYEYAGAQTFIPVPQSGSNIVEMATDAASRTWPDTVPQRIVKSQIEVACLVNVPEAEDVATNKLRWSISKPGDGVPPGTPRFEYEAHGLDRSTATREETQVAMLNAADGGVSEPLWLGTGVKHGTEAGLFGDKLIHQFVGGTTGMGKTTFLTNYAGQVFRGPGAGIAFDPKGKDADEFIAVWPEDREPEDIITMDLTGEFDEIPRFNFLEIPDYLEPGTRAFNSYCEALADDVTAMVAEAGGSDKYMGALMKRTVRTAVRGLAKMSDTMTLLDLAAVCSGPDQLDRFRDHMADEHYKNYEETEMQNLMEAVDQLASKDANDFEPLVGRMNEWVLNENIRELICARDSSFSVDDVVREGKWIVVGCNPSGGDTEASMLGTALIRRTYFAQRHLQPGHPFDLICDEFDNVASEESNIHKILSEARAFDYRCTLASQAPTNQFPDRVQNAIENQCGTFISFNPGGGKDARWISQQHTAEKEELLNLGRYVFYMRSTTKDNQLTPSYLVKGFPPFREAATDARTDAEIRQLKEESLAIYGEPVKSEAELRDESPYLSGSSPLDAADDGEEAPTNHEPTLCKAVYDAALHANDDGTEWADGDAVRERLERYSDESWTSAQFGALAETTTEVEYRDTAETVELRCSDAGFDRFMPAGDNQTEGAIPHRSLLKHAYDGLSSLGLEVELPEQSGGAEVDGTGRIRETFDPDVNPRDDPAAFSEAFDAFRDNHATLAALTEGKDVTIESESHTSSKPAATCTNLVKATADNKVCLFLARPEKAGTVYGTLTDPPYLHGSPGDADRRFYNRKRLAIDGERVLRPTGAKRTVWTEQDGEIILSDNEGREHARFDSPDAVFNDRSTYPAHTGEVDDSEIGEGETWRPVAAPWIPEREFENGVPDGDAWRLLVVERDGTLTRFSDDETLYTSEDEDSEDAASTPPDEPAPSDEDLWGELEGFTEGES